MWWRDGVIYQIYVRSFCDSDGDGVGDLPGLVSRLDHLSWLGVDALWLSPIHPSPNADWGYDVADYYGIHPDYGSLADFDRLVEEARARGMRVVLDLVPNHTSSDNEWFRQARTSRDSPRRGWYVWADGDGTEPPNNWVSSFGGPAWTFDDATGQFYLHNFLPEQPDLDWWNDEVRDEFDRVQRYWYDRGVAGFRIDVCHMVVKDRELRDNPPAGPDDHWMDRLRGQVPVHNTNQPGVHEVLRRWRRTAESYEEPRMLLGETYIHDLPRLREYYGVDDELHLAFNIPFVHSPLDAERMRSIVASIEALFPAFAVPCWTGSNHDAGRFPSRWCSDDEDLVRCALVMLLTLRGTAVLYYGDEIGMGNAEIPPGRVLDPVGRRFPAAGRDPGRTPMAWTSRPGAGFTGDGVDPWLPFGDLTRNVEAQRDDASSVLHLTRDLIGLRRRRADLRDGYVAIDDVPSNVWAYRRGTHTLVVVNLGTERFDAADVAGEILVCTDRSRDGESVSGALAVGGRTAVVVALA